MGTWRCLGVQRIPGQSSNEYLVSFTQAPILSLFPTCRTSVKDWRIKATPERAVCSQTILSVLVVVN